jgi:hypothetical protein
MDRDTDYDSLDLTKAVQRHLVDLMSTRGRDTAAVYVDAEEMAGAVRPSGTYSINGDTVKVRLVLRRDGQSVGAPLQVEGIKTDVPNLRGCMGTISALVRTRCHARIRSIGQTLTKHPTCRLSLTFVPAYAKCSCVENASIHPLTKQIVSAITGALAHTGIPAK